MIKSDLVERAKVAAHVRGLTLEVRKIPNRENSYHFRFSGDRSFSRSYAGNLVEDVEQAADSLISIRKKYQEQLAERRKVVATYEAERKVMLEKFTARFRMDEKSSIHAGPLTLQVESVGTDKVCIFTQQDLTWDEFGELIRSIK